MSEKDSPAKDPTQAAREIAAALDAVGCEYAIGGAIALGFWAEPRGTLDVDVTLFLPPNKPLSCVRTLQQIGCEVNVDQASRSLAKYGFCQVDFHGRRIDAFLPIVPFYEHARNRRAVVQLSDQPVKIWDAATLCVFKMMFFRRKDLADVEQLLRMQGEHLDHDWVLQRLTELYGGLDPRISQWQDLMREVGE